MGHPAVSAAAVVGRPDAKSGEEVVAVVSLVSRRGGDAGGAHRVRPRRSLAKYKYPREILIVDAVPLTSVGKTDRKAVRGLVRD